jgi:hypothetical protein
VLAGSAPQRVALDTFEALELAGCFAALSIHPSAQKPRRCRFALASIDRGGGLAAEVRRTAFLALDVDFDAGVVFPAAKELWAVGVVRAVQRQRHARGAQTQQQSETKTVAMHARPRTQGLCHDVPSANSALRTAVVCQSVPITPRVRLPTPQAHAESTASAQARRKVHDCVLRS